MSLRLPHPNTYRVPGAPMLAGEYPFTDRSPADREKLRAFLDAGVTHFLDLTDVGELEPYEPALREMAAERGIAVEYARLPIRDMDIATVERMDEILATLDRFQREGGLTYVHCWGGVGRTGTVVGCYLVRRGIDADEVLARVGDLFRTMSADKVRRHPEGSPQTSAQRRFVRQWAKRSMEEPPPTPAPEPLA